MERKTLKEIPGISIVYYYEDYYYEPELIGNLANLHAFRSIPPEARLLGTLPIN